LLKSLVAALALVIVAPAAYQSSLPVQSGPDPLSILKALGVQTNVPETFSKRVVKAGLSDPWEVLWGQDSRLWVTERSQKRIIRVDPVTGATATLATIPESFREDSQDGVLGLALHSGLLRQSNQDYVYVTFVYDANRGPDVDRRMMLRRYTFDRVNGMLGNPIDLLSGLPSNDDHVAGRLVFGPDQKLYLTIGDLAANNSWNACHPNHAQDLPSEADIAAHDWRLYQGKTLRINLDGSIPADNPVLRNVKSHIYTYGHRNAQGLAFGPTGRLYASEHGPSTDDELNLIMAGRNYGWPYVAGYKDDRAYVYANWSASAPAPCNSLRFDPLVAPASVPQQKESAWNGPDFTPPLRTFFTVDSTYRFQELGNATVAPSGIDVYTTARGIPNWANSILMTSLTKGTILRTKLSTDGTSVVGPTSAYFPSRSRYRDVAISPDGLTIFVATDSRGSQEDGGSILAFTYTGPR